MEDQLWLGGKWVVKKGNSQSPCSLRQIRSEQAIQTIFRLQCCRGFNSNFSVLSCKGMQQVSVRRRGFPTDFPEVWNIFGK